MKNSATKLHYHNYYELIYCYNGTGKIKYNSDPITSSNDYSRTLYANQNVETNEEIEFKENTAIIFEPNVIHNEYYTSQTTDILSIGFHLDENEAILNKFSQTNDGTFFIKKNIENIEEEYNNKDFNYAVNIESYIHLISNFILRHNESKHALSNNTFDFNYVLNYINESFKNEINIDALANMVGYCPDYFRILFKENAGMTPKQYIIKKRMEYALHLIKETDINLSDIAKECGYEDYFQFSTYFKKYYGYSPKSVRKIS